MSTTSDGYRFAICIRIARPEQQWDGLKRNELRQALEMASRGFPLELRPRFQKKPGDKKTDVDVVDTIVVSILLGRYVVRPILKFIVDLAKTKHTKLKIRTRSHTDRGIEEREVVYEGPESLSHIEPMVEDAVRDSRNSSLPSTPSATQLQAPLPDLEIEVLLPTDVEPENAS